MARRDLPKIDTSCLKPHIDAMAEQAVDVTPDASFRQLNNGLDTAMPEFG